MRLTSAASNGCVGLLSNGRIAVGGFSAGGPAITSAFVAGLTASGAVDTGSQGFGPQGQGNNLIQFPVKFGSSVKTQFSTFDDIAVQSDNKMVAVGSYLGRDAANNLVDTLVVARYTAAAGQGRRTSSGSQQDVCEELIVPAG
jgi:hypothetical protein